MMFHKNSPFDSKSRRSCPGIIIQAASLFCLLYLLINFAGWSLKTPERAISSVSDGLSDVSLVTDNCEDRCRPAGSESLPKGIVENVTNLEMRPLWGHPEEHPPMNLLAVAAGVKQKRLVNEMVAKFLANDFVVMMFHYDGNVDDWKEFGWSDEVIHVSAASQTKWWFAKRFLHPDILADYEYVFLWDEDLGVQHFDPKRYLAIVKEEGLEISQPALSDKSDVHHQITSRGRRGNVHRRIYKPGKCYSNSTAPPCTGWIEVMAPVFSKSAWRCVWHMIQNDLIHAWGLDMQLGYCAQGDRTEKVGVVDAEYVDHFGLPTLGEPNADKAPPQNHTVDRRVEVRRQSFNEYKTFKKRWEEAASKDECWSEPYPNPTNTPF